MKVLFVGASKFGLKCLEHIHSLNDIDITGVISNKKEFAISYSKKPVTNILHADLQQFASQNKIPYYEMQENMKERRLMEFLKKLKPELILVVGWYHMIPNSILSSYTCAGLHASLLPEYSGGAPLVWAMINGEKETGITFFKFDKGVDSGPIIGQKRIKIKNTDTIKTLYKKIEKKGIELLKEYIPRLVDKSVNYIMQDNSKRTKYPQRSPEDGLIDWKWDEKKIKNFIRAQTKPYPGAYTIIRNKKIIIWDAEISELD